MARTESNVLADISNTEAKIAQLISATGNAGDFGIGDTKVNRASMLNAMEARLVRLHKELDEYPAEEITTVDINIDTATGNDNTEFVEDYP